VRKIIFGLVALAAFALVHHEAAAAGVKITEQNVKDVCGAKLQSGGGMMGCTKTCGSNGEHLCDFHCEGGNKCEGQCLNCGVKERELPSKSSAIALRNRVVKEEIRRSGPQSQ
jgi:hypothetical protein